MQDVQDGIELGTASTQGHPFKRVWDAALLLYGMGLLHFQVSSLDAVHSAAGCLCIWATIVSLEQSKHS